MKKLSLPGLGNNRPTAEASARGITATAVNSDKVRNALRRDQAVIVGLRQKRRGPWRLSQSELIFL